MLSDIRGHDFLAYAGIWASENGHGILKRGENIIDEIDGLRAVGKELELKGCNKADFKLSLGPQPGSFFADARGLGSYRHSKNLPTDLDNAITDELSVRGYGTISDVVMNATGGWVMYVRVENAMGRFFRGHKRRPQFCWGGIKGLPGEIIEALQEGRERGATISVCLETTV